MADDIRFIECTLGDHHRCAKLVEYAHRQCKAAIVFHVSHRNPQCVNVGVLFPRGKMRLSKTGKSAVGQLYEVYVLAAWIDHDGMCDTHRTGFVIDGIKPTFLDPFIEDLLRLLQCDGNILQRGTSEHSG